MAPLLAVEHRKKRPLEACQSSRFHDTSRFKSRGYIICLKRLIGVGF
jgi:hypothetical protein